MALTLKRDNTGHVVCNDTGLPVWVAEDGKEIAYDVNDLVGKVSTMSGEKTEHDKTLAALNAKLAAFDGIDAEKARTALETLSNIDAGKLVDAGKVDDLKKQIGQSYEAKILDLEKARSTDAEKHTSAMQAKDDSIRRLMVKSAFDASPFLREKTVLPPDMAYQCFGNTFEVKDENGDLHVMASLNGNPIFSRSKPGALADPEEALEIIINAYPMKENILRTTASGSGTQSTDKHAARGATKSMGRAAFDSLSATDKAAFMRDGGNLID